MCEIGAHCPNCGQLDLDEDETSCITIEEAVYREYRCHACRAYISVHAYAKQSRSKPRIVDVPLPG